MEKKDFWKFLLGIAIITIIFSSQAAGVAAVNDQGLSWGVEVDDRFDYNVEMEYRSPTLNVSIDDRMYVIVNELNTIPDYVTQLTDITIFRLTLDSYTTYWDNGTIMNHFWFDVFDMPNPFSTYPVGNWSLISQIFEDAAPVIITQNTTTMNYSLVDFPVLGNVHETIFLKSNGVPHSTVYIRTGDSGETINMNLTLIHTPNTGEGDSILLPILIGGALVAVIVTAVVILRRE